MPYPAQISPERILDRAEHLIETHGAEQMSLHQLAADLSVKTPSLYRYYANKAELLRAVNLRTAEGLIAAMQDAARSPAAPDTERVLRMAAAYRTFARAHPRCYLLAYGSTEAALRPDEATLAALAQQIQDVIAPMTRTVDSLTALRGLWALVHGFITLEMTAQMQRGGDLEAAFHSVVRVYMRGLTEG